MVADHLRGWIEGKKGLEPSTKRSYRMYIETHLIPLLGNVRGAPCRSTGAAVVIGVAAADPLHAPQGAQRRGP